jgi:hypothetical protein
MIGGNPSCFGASAPARPRGQITTEKYFDNMLARLSRARDSEDITQNTLWGSAGVSIGL